MRKRLLTPLVARLVLGASALIVFLALAASPAAAKKTHLLEGTFGSAAQQSFSAANALAVDQSTGDLLVIDSQAKTLTRYHADGTPADFTALGTNVIDGKGVGDQTPQNGFTFRSVEGEQQVAIDNSGTVTDGDIYVTQAFEAGGNLVDIFSASGEYLGQLTKAGASGSRFGTTGSAPLSPYGVTVDAAGNVYLGGGYDNKIYKFHPTTDPVVNADFVSAFTPVDKPFGSMAAGAGPSADYLFVTTPFTAEEDSGLKLDSASGGLKEILDSGEDSLVSVNPISGHVYFFGGTLIPPNNTVGNLRVNEYDAAGSLASTIPINFSVQGIAVDGASGRIYISAGGGIVRVYGPLVTVPDVSTGGFEVLGDTSIRVKGTVDPDGVALEEMLLRIRSHQLLRSEQTLLGISG